MVFTEHLGELRKRLVISLVALLIGTVISFAYTENLFVLLTLPLHKKIVFSTSFPFFSFVSTSHPDISLVFLTPIEAFWMHIKVAIISGVILSFPVILYEIWKFISPGLLPKERKLAFPFIIISTFLFFAGIFFCFIIVLPFAINFLLTYKTQHLVPMLSVGSYADFCFKFILAFGAVFELPLVIVFFTKLGIISTSFLAKNRKYAVLLAFIIAAVLTPTPDALNQSLMALPIILLYEVGILASKLFEPIR